jgi:hypothetical protein
VVTTQIFGWTFVREFEGAEVRTIEERSAGSFNGIPFHSLGLTDTAGRKHGVTPLIRHLGTARALAAEWTEILRSAGE